jgi:hypothetical protein
VNVLHHALGVWVKVLVFLEVLLLEGNATVSAREQPVCASLAHSVTCTTDAQQLGETVVVRQAVHAQGQWRGHELPAEQLEAPGHEWVAARPQLWCDRVRACLAPLWAPLLGVNTNSATPALGAHVWQTFWTTVTRTDGWITISTGKSYRFNRHRSLGRSSRLRAGTCGCFLCKNYHINVSISVALNETSLFAVWLDVHTLSLQFLTSAVLFGICT